MANESVYSDIPQRSVAAYRDCLPIKTPRKQIPPEIIKEKGLACLKKKNSAKYGSIKTLRIHDHKLWDGDKKLCHYYVNQYGPSFPTPWYGVSKNLQDNLKEDNIPVLCMYFKAAGSGYTVFYKLWEPQKIESDWQLSTGNRYLWNPGKGYETSMKQL